VLDQHELHGRRARLQHVDERVRSMSDQRELHECYAPELQHDDAPLRAVTAIR
jgi:hypothetical protein